MKFAKSKVFKTCCVLMIALTLMAQQPVTVSSGTVTANAGTNLNTSALALDSTVSTVDTDVKSNITLHAGTNVIGHVIVDTAPSTAVTNAGTFAVQATQSGNWTSRIVGNGGGLLDAIGQNVAAPANWLSVGCDFFTTPTTITTVPVTTVVLPESVITWPMTFDPAGIAVLRFTNRFPAESHSRFDPLPAGGLGSGATGGDVIAIPVGDTYKNINISTATTTLLVTGVASRQVRITALHMVTALANNVALIEGTGATCGTGTAGMAGGTTAASGYNLVANGGMTLGSGLGTVIATVTTGDSVCAVTSASTQLSGGIEYTIY